jgi:long-chain acyl-CoA synthetase
MSMVYGEDDSIVAEIYPDPEAEDAQAIINDKVNEVNQKLPIFKRISRVKFTDTEFPKTTTKKIKRTHNSK